MIEIRQTDVYARWFGNLRDRQARARIDYGHGYRVYFVEHGQAIVVLLAGGDKRTQDRDIKTALDLARNL